MFILSKLTLFLKNNSKEIFICALFLAGTLSSLLTEKDTRRVEILWDQRRQKEAEVKQLAELSLKYPDYRDLLYQLTALEWELGNIDSAQESLAKAKYLDPNNQITKLLEELLNKR